MRVFLSLPMKDRKDEDIKFTIAKMKSVIKAMYPNEEIEFVDNFLTTEECEFLKKKNTAFYDEVKNDTIMYLGAAIQKMSSCDAMAFLDIRDMYELRSRGCEIEMRVADIYGIEGIPLVDPQGKIYVPDLWKKHEEHLKKQREMRPVYYNRDCNGEEACPDDEREINY